MLHKAQNEKVVIFHLPFFIHLSVEYVIVTFVVERGNTGVVLENGRSAGESGEKLVGRRRGRSHIVASL